MGGEGRGGEVGGEGDVSRGEGRWLQFTYIVHSAGMVLDTADHTTL